MAGEPPAAALANNRIIINTHGGLPEASQASPPGPAGRAPDGPDPPRGHSNHIQVAPCLPPDPRGVGQTRPGHCSPIAAELCVCGFWCAFLRAKSGVLEWAWWSPVSADGDSGGG